MNDNSGVKNAMAKFYERQLVKESGPKRTNEKPERDTEREVVAWLRAQGLFHKIVESKAVLSSQYSGYRRGQADAGFPDLVGLTRKGFFLAVELKARGRRSNLSDQQREFLISVIDSKGFACVTDSADHLSALFFAWEAAPVETRSELLLADLPKQRVAKDDGRPLFDDND
jgi:hypothetical protein